MQFDYIASRDAVNGSGSPFREESAYPSLPETYESSYQSSYTPPAFFDDPETGILRLAGRTALSSRNQSAICDHCQAHQPRDWLLNSKPRAVGQ